MKRTVVAISVLLVTLILISTASAASAPRRMRPYAGIGVLFLPHQTTPEEEPLPLYEVPGLARIGSLTAAPASGSDWIFGEASGAYPVIVTGRKDAWLRVTYDDAGREAWLKPPSSARYLSWEQYFKSSLAAVLPGVQKKYLQFHQQPGGALLASLAPRQAFRVIKLEHDWAMVIHPDQGSLGWLRWRDDDGRLLLGVVSVAVAVLP